MGKYDLIKASHLVFSNIFRPSYVIDRHGNTVLHNALQQKIMTLLNYLLKRNDTDLDCRNHYGETPLLLSIKHDHQFATIMQLIELGCDINIADHMGTTPLHMTISRRNLDVARELIKRGADINACSLNGNSPLFYAINSQNVEIFCMLLYYGADVTIRNKKGLTAFTYAMQKYSRAFVSLLLPYYDDFNYVDQDDYSPLHLAIEFENKLALKLLDLGADVNGITNQGYCALELALTLDSPEVFMKIWPKMDYQILLYIRNPLLSSLFSVEWNFTTAEWLECCYMILECPIAFDLMQHYSDYAELRGDPDFYQILMNTLYKKRVKSIDRVNILSMCLTLGEEVKMMNLDLTIKLFGFKEEFEMLLYAIGDLKGANHFTHPLLPCILGLENFDIKRIIKLFKTQIKRSTSSVSEVKTIENSIINCLGYFSISRPNKQKIYRTWQLYLINYEFILENIVLIPEFPSLLELSRNQAHRFIREKYNFKRPYHFHDAIKNLPLPECIKDLIRFKKPLYALSV